MSHVVHDFVQGSPEWHRHRATHYNASDAAQMLGISRFGSRADLVRLYATGGDREFSEHQMRVLARGHEIEETARAAVEGQTREELYPMVASRVVGGLRLSASFDGVPMDESWAWECKSKNEALWASMLDGVIPPEYHPQLEHGQIVLGITGSLFTVSDGHEHIGSWYESDPELRARIIAGWKQFAADVQAYVHVEVPPKVEAPVESLPAVSVRIEGHLQVVDNLQVFGRRLREFVDRIPAQPETDEDFAVAESAVKTLEKAEAALTQAENAGLSQLETVEVMRRMVADLRSLARSTRLATTKLVEARKTAIRAEQIERGKREVAAFVREINAAWARPYLPVPSVDFAAAIKGRRTVQTVRDAIDGAVAAAKIEASECAARIGTNLRAFEACEYPALFADLAQIVTKAPDDFEAVLQARIARQKAEEERRMAAERARTEAEAQAKAQREAAALAEQERRRSAEEERAKARAQAAPQDDFPPEPFVAQRIQNPSPLDEIAVARALVQDEKAEARTEPMVTLDEIGDVLSLVPYPKLLVDLGFPMGCPEDGWIVAVSELPRICRALAAHLLHVSARLAEKGPA